MRDQLGVIPHNVTSSSPLIIGDSIFDYSGDIIGYKFKAGGMYGYFSDIKFRSRL